MYSTLVESLKRLYKGGSKVVTKEKLQSMFDIGTLTEDEYNYIIS